jgi:hypothetical protein
MRKKDGRPCLLVLGAGASVQSGTSRWEEVIDNALKELEIPTEGLDFDQKYRVLCEAIRNVGLTNRDVCAVMRWSLRVGKPSDGYFKLASIIREGFFKVVFTTNWDSHLVETLQRVGLDNSAVATMVYGRNRTGSPVEDIAKVLEFGPHQAKIVKLHGDLDMCNAIVCEGAFQFERKMEKLLKAWFLNHIVVVGASFSDLDMVRCIEAPKGSGRIWFVNRAQPEYQVQQILEGRGSANDIILGEMGEFDTFFDLLAKELGVSVPRLARQSLPVHTDLLREYATGIWRFKYKTLSGKETTWKYQIIKFAPSASEDFEPSENNRYGQLKIWATTKCPECSRNMRFNLEVGLVKAPKWNLQKDLLCECGSKFLLAGNFSYLKQVLSRRGRRLK